MNSATPAIQNLARRLIAIEASHETSSVACGSEAVRVCEKLRVPLAKFLGTAGYRSLMGRALALAKPESPSLNSVDLQLDGSLVGISQEDTEAAFIILVNLLVLLVTFVGELMTLRLIFDVWPEASLDEADTSAEELS